MPISVKQCLISHSSESTYRKIPKICSPVNKPMVLFLSVIIKKNSWENPLNYKKYALTKISPEFYGIGIFWNLVRW